MLAAVGVRRTGEGRRRGPAGGEEAGIVAVGLALLSSCCRCTSPLPTASSTPPTTSRNAALLGVMVGTAIPLATASSMLVIEEPRDPAGVGGDGPGGRRTGSRAWAGVGLEGRLVTGEYDEGPDPLKASSRGLAEMLIPVMLLIISSLTASSSSRASSLLTPPAGLVGGLTGNVALTGTALPNPPLPCPRCER